MADSQTRLKAVTEARPPLRVVLFTGGPTLDPQVLDFLERLEEIPAIELVGVYVQATHRGFRGRIRDLWSRRGLLAGPLLLQVFGRWLWRQTGSPREAMRRRRYAARICERVHYVSDLHDPAVLDRLRGSAPGLGLVYGGPVIRSALFEMPLHGTLGIHHGKLPAYRGKKTTFWAIYNEEETVGVAIQRIGSRLDGGDIVAQALVPVGRRTPAAVARELERNGIELYLRAVRAVRDGTATYTPQPEEVGTLYRDPGVVDILRFWYRYARRLCRR